MAKVPVTKEFFDKFGKGDQLHVCYPEGKRFVAEIEEIRLIPRPSNNDQELLVVAGGFVEFGEYAEDGVAPRPDLDHYGSPGPLLSDLFVARDEDGFAEVPYIPGEQILLFVKSTHRAFVHMPIAPSVIPAATDGPSSS